MAAPRKSKYVPQKYTKITKMYLQKFVEGVKGYPCLYNTNDIGYKNFKLKEKTWSSIGFQCGYSGNTAKSKWKGIRDRYVKVKRRMAREIMNGNEATPPKWFLFNILDSFLMNTLTESKKITNGDCDLPVEIAIDKDSFPEIESSEESKPSIENDLRIEQDNMSNDRIVCASPASVSMSPQSPIKIRYKHPNFANDKIIDGNNEMEKIMYTMNSTLQKIEQNVLKHQEDLDDTTLYLLSLAPRMRRLSPQRRSQLKIKFEQTLFEFETGD